MYLSDTNATGGVAIRGVMSVRRTEYKCNNAHMQPALLTGKRRSEYISKGPEKKIYICKKQPSYKSGYASVS